MSIRRFAGLLSLLFCSTLSFAGPIITTGANNGIQLDVIGLTGFATLGSDMGGLSVTAVYAQGATASCIWAPTSATAGGCSVANAFSIEEDGDTFTNDWSFQNLSTFDSVVTLILDGTPQRMSTEGVVFDRTFGGATGTLGSALGADATGTADDPAVGIATYSNIVAVSPDAPVGDIYTTLTIAFDLGLRPGMSATFVADTDTIGTFIPEPGSLGLLGLGLVGLGLLGRKLRS